VTLTTVIDADVYCREIEAYLCRKNDGHLVRIVGPAFERVRAWAGQGIPARVACAGIDRYFERYYRRGPRRRPVRIEFCEADVLDAFDDWRRAVGVNAPATADSGAQDEEPPPARRRSSLAGHIEETIARLTALRSSTSAVRLPSDVLESAVRKLDHLLPGARKARGDARDVIVQELTAVERELLDAATALLNDAEAAEMASEVDRELAPFRARMTPEAFAGATHAATLRLVRERFVLPKIGFD
jgi:hypothetical protein